MVKESDKNFEAFILGAVLQDKYATSQTMQNMEIEDFYYIEHKEIFKAYKSLFRKGCEININMVLTELKDSLQLEKTGGYLYLKYLVDNSVAVDVDYYINEVKAFASRRKLLVVADDIFKKALDPKYEPNELIEKYSKEISMIGTFTRDQFVPVGDLSENFKDSKKYSTVLQEECFRASQGEDIFEGVRTHYPRLDNLIGGFIRGSNTIIGARSSSGKTTFLSNLFLNIFYNSPHIRMGFFSLEMSKSRIMEKIVCTMAGVNYKDVVERRIGPMEIEKIVEAEKNLSTMNLKIFDRSGININDFKSVIRREAIRSGLDIVFLDYLSIVQAFYRSGNKHQEIDQISKGIQSIGLELNIAMVSLSQLNRSIYGRTDKTPVLSDLRESGSIEEDADTVLLLHRPSHYLPANAQTQEDILQCIVAKSRLMGDLGKIEFEFNAGRYHERQKIEELLPNQVINSFDAKEDFKPSSFF